MKDGVLLTPPTPADLLNPDIADRVAYPKSATLPGVTRQIVLELAEQNGIETCIAAIDVNQLLEADEVFLTNSIMGVMPVCRIEKKAIGEDRPGAVTIAISDHYAASVSK